LDRLAQSSGVERICDPFCVSIVFDPIKRRHDITIRVFAYRERSTLY
jgi:hypothetical protein